MATEEGSYNFTVKIISFNYPAFNGTSPQVTAIASIMGMEITIEIEEEITVGKEFNVTARLSNTGQVSIRGVNVTISLPDGTALAAGSETQTVGTVAPGEEKQASWTIKAEKEGAYAFNITVESKNYSTVQKASLEVNAIKPPFWTPIMIAAITGGLVVVAVMIAVTIYYAKRRKIQKGVITS